jgi:prepilin signal peptidase PulO-like enzyme (type II secretory pathway)
VGLYCGWLGWPAVFNATLLAFVAAALFVLICRLATVGTRRRTMPMAPFMAVGALAVIVLSR